MLFSFELIVYANYAQSNRELQVNYIYNNIRPSVCNLFIGLEYRMFRTLWFLFCFWEDVWNRWCTLLPSCLSEVWSTVDISVSIIKLMAKRLNGWLFEFDCRLEWKFCVVRFLECIIILYNKWMTADIIQKKKNSRNWQEETHRNSYDFNYHFNRYYCICMSRTEL